MVAGQTGSGKTVFVRKFLESFNQLTTLKQYPARVLWCYGQWQSGYFDPIQNVHVKYVEGLASPETISEFRPDFIVVDDLMQELAGNPELSKLFTKGSHHQGFSVIFIVQNIFYQAKEMRTISLNCHMIVVMKNVRDRSQIINLGKQLYPHATRQFLDIYRDATSTPYSYLFIDLQPNTPDNLRLRGEVLPTKDHQNITIYSPPNNV
ncbi:hypothetical protein HDE_09790 [Halotydeus destructor]|nr:hypothetical protein HDE_09790 [Halotydeus destructor]